MSKGRPPPSRSPQDKKALSYANDRRNDYGDNAKASRKAIPARKATENRDVRRKAVQAVKATAISDEATVDLIESSLRHDLDRLGGWKKSLDVPLGELLKRKAHRRAPKGT